MKSAVILSIFTAAVAASPLAFISEEVAASLSRDSSPGLLRSPVLNKPCHKGTAKDALKNFLKSLGLDAGAHRDAPPTPVAGFDRVLASPAHHGKGISLDFGLVDADKHANKFPYWVKHPPSSMIQIAPESETKPTDTIFVIDHLMAPEEHQHHRGPHHGHRVHRLRETLSGRIDDAFNSLTFAEGTFLFLIFGVGLGHLLGILCLITYRLVTRHRADKTGRGRCCAGRAAGLNAETVPAAPAISEKAALVIEAPVEAAAPVYVEATPLVDLEKA